MTGRWRSLLFTPGDAPEKLAKAAARGADAVIIDLEDAVAPSARDRARDALGPAVEILAAQGQDVAVRINAPWRLAVQDLEAAIRPGVSAIVAPKAEHAADLAVLSRMITEWECARGLDAGAVGLIALVETPRGLLNLSALVEVDRLIGLALGSEDLSAGLGVEPSADNLDLPCRMLALAAASRRLMAIGMPISITTLRDEAAVSQAAAAARGMGMTGALCIHPDQVRIVNAAFRPTESELASARRVVEAWTRRGDQAVLEVDGRMVDPPVAQRAEALLARFQAEPET